MTKIKILALFLITILFTNCVFSEETVEQNINKNLAPKSVRIITNALGCNFFATQIAQGVIKKTIKKNAKGDFKVKIKSFSAMDLKKGKFKSLVVKGENISGSGCYISEATFKTINNYNYVDYTKNDVVFMEDMPMSFSVVLTEDDLNKTLIDVGYLKKLLDTKIACCNIFEIDNIYFALKSNRLYLITKVKVPFLMADRCIKVTFSGKLNVENGKIVLDNVETNSLRSTNFSKLIDLINSVNPFDIPLNLFKNTDSQMTVKNVKILDNKIYIDGIIVIKRSYRYGQTEEK